MRGLYAPSREDEKERLTKQATQWNAPAEVLAQLEQQLPEEPDDVVVWPENQLTMLLFITCQTQWLYAGMTGTRVGLNWQSLELAMKRNGDFRALDEPGKDEVFNDLVLVERVVLTEIRKTEKQTS